MKKGKYLATPQKDPGMLLLWICGAVLLVGILLLVAWLIVTNNQPEPPLETSPTEAAEAIDATVEIASGKTVRR